VKYYKITNDILETFNKGAGYKVDEPQYIHDLGKAKKIIRLIGEGIYTYIKTDKDIDFSDKSNITEISYMELEAVYKKAQPEIKRYLNTKTLDTYSEEEVAAKLTLLDNPDIKEDYVKTMGDIDKEIEMANSHKFGANWTGNVNGFDMADGDHVTGDLTNANGFEGKIQAGAEILVDGDYYFRNYGKATYDGTSGKITIKSNLANPMGNSWGELTFDDIDSGSVVKYVELRNCQEGFILAGTTSDSELTISNLSTVNCQISVSQEMDAGCNVTISNSLFEGSGQYAIVIITNNAMTLTLSDCEIKSYDRLFNSSSGAISPTLALSNCKIEDTRMGNCYFKFDVDNCYFNNITCTYYLQFLTTTTSTLDNSMFIRFTGTTYSFLRCGTGNVAVTNCDIGLVNYWSGASVCYGGGTYTNVAIFGCKTYDPLVFDTYTAGDDSDLGFIVDATSIVSLSATRNETFIPASIAESALGDNGVTIGWTGGTGLIKSKHRIRYGTTSGVYTMVATKKWDWSNHDGLHDIMTTTPSFDLANLKSGTKYYYICETYDPAFDVWNASAERNFTTTAVPRILQLDIATNLIAYGSGDAIEVSGTVKFDSAIVNANVKVTIHKLSDDSLITTLMEKNTNLAAGVAKTFETINGSALSWSTATLLSYYAKVVVSGGTPTIDGILNDLENDYGFIVQDITQISLPVGVSVEEPAVSVEVNL